MQIKLEDVAPWARATQNLFNANFDGVTAYDTDLADPYNADVWTPIIEAVETMILPQGLIKLNKQQTGERNGKLKAESPLITDLEFAINKCIKAGTITDGIGAFDLTALKRSITNKDINAFHTAYDICYARIVANATPLAAKGFTTDKKNAFKANHDSAMQIQNSRQARKLEIKDLSSADQTKVNLCISTSQSVIDSIFAYAKSTSNEDLMKEATGKAILKSVVPTPEKKARIRKMNATETIIYQRNISGTKTMQFTVKTKETIQLGKSETIEGTPSATMNLAPETLVSVKKAQIPGTGEFIKLINPNLTKAEVEVFIIDPKK
jgi:hypothetical protein